MKKIIEIRRTSNYIKMSKTQWLDIIKNIQLYQKKIERLERELKKLNGE